MALTTPILDKIIPFPSTSSHDFTFSVISGDQVTANSLIIERVSDNIVIYNTKIESFIFKHTLPANTLINGIQYRAKVKTYNIINQESQLSDSVLFYCFSTPTITVNVKSGDIINSSSKEFIGTYSQLENEQLQSYKFYLYDSNSVLLSASVEKFDGLLKHTFSGLQDDGQYKIELKTYTVNGIETSTGLIPFSVNYISPIFNTALVLENINDQAAIKISCHILNIVGLVNTGTITYELNDWINLKSGSIYFEEGFTIKKDFTLKFWCKDLIKYETLIELIGDKGGNIVVKYFNNKFHVYKNLGTLTSYYIYSNDITLLSTDIVCVQIQQQNNLLNLQCQKVV